MLLSDIASDILCDMTSDTAERVRENRVRRMAQRQGLAVHKIRRRDPRAWDYGLFNLTDPTSNTLVIGPVSLDAVESRLLGD